MGALCTAGGRLGKVSHVKSRIDGRYENGARRFPLSRRARASIDGLPSVLELTLVQIAVVLDAGDTQTLHAGAVYGALP